MANNTKARTEYDVARNDYQKAIAAVTLSSRKQDVDAAWDWARIAANHAEALGVWGARGSLGIGVWPDLKHIEQELSKHRDSEILIVTRHAGFVEWLERRGLVGLVIERATPAQVIGKDVIGNLPWQLAAVARSFSRIAIPGCPSDRRQDELSANELDEYGAFLRTYTVKEVQAIQP